MSEKSKILDERGRQSEKASRPKRWIHPLIASLPPPKAPPPAYRLRTITLFLDLHQYPNLASWDEAMQQASLLFSTLTTALEPTRVELQTVRIATNLFTPPTATSLVADVDSVEQLVDMAVSLESIALKHGIQFLSLGAASPSPHSCAAIPLILAKTSIVSCSLALSSLCMSSLDCVQQCSQVILRIAQITPHGLGSFRFSVTSLCERAAIPYFPAAHCATERDKGGDGSVLKPRYVPYATSLHHCLVLGLENAGLFYHAMQKTNLEEEEQAMATALEAAWRPICSAIQASLPSPYRLYGLDTSIAPALDGPSMTDAFERALDDAEYRFGKAGTLALCSAVTRTLQQGFSGLPFTGYSGLMLAVCEDMGLARAAKEGRVSVSSLMQYAAVCGVGIDVVPCEGIGCDETPARVDKLRHAIARLLLDMHALSLRLDKPLSCRLLPIADGKVGDETRLCQYNPYLVEGIVMDVQV